MNEVDRRVFTERPSEPVRLMWRRWLERHGIDPNDVPVIGWIERREQDYQIAYEAYVRDEQGRVRADPVTDQDLRVVRVFQLEGPPLPWPDRVILTRRPGVTYIP